MVLLLAPTALAIRASNCPTAAAAPKLSLLRLRGGTPQAALLDHSTAVAGLFNNMKTPATLLFGALVPLGATRPLHRAS